MTTPSLPVRVVAGVAYRRILRAEGVYEKPAPGRIDDVSDVEEHHVAKAVDMPAPHVVSSLFAALDVVPCVGELAQDTRGVPIAGVREVPPLYVAESRYAQVLNARVVHHPAIRIFLSLLVVEVQVARVPAVCCRITPSFEFDHLLDMTGFGEFHCAAPGNVFRATLYRDLHPAAGDTQTEFTVGIEERLARSDFPHRVGGSQRSAVVSDYLDPCAHLLPGGSVHDPAGQCEVAGAVVDQIAYRFDFVVLLAAASQGAAVAVDGRVRLTVPVGV